MGRIPGWLKVGFSAWVALWVPFYWWWYGPQNFLWFCDIGNFVLCVALWRESRLLFSWQAVSLLIVQSAWTVDLAGRLLLGVHPIGGSEYLFDEAIPLVVRLLSLFHGVTPFLMIWAIRKLGYDRRGFALQTLTAWVVLPVCWLAFGPELDLNWVWGPFDRPQEVVAPAVYLGACMVGYPIALYLPTHLLLSRCAGN